MNGDADLPHRSSSPLKRRASSMDPAANSTKSADRASTPSSGESGNQLSNGYPRAMSVDMPDGAALEPGPGPPPLLEQVKIIETVLKAFAEAPLKEGDQAYLVSRSWVDKALAFRSGSKHSKENLDDTPLGPVDNSDIIEETLEEPDGRKFVRLKPDSGLEEFELFPQDAWQMVMDWYGIKEGQEAIIRTAIDTAPDSQSDPNILYEFHPPIFRVHRLWSEVSTLPIEQALKARNPPPLVLARSRKYHTQTFIRELKKFSGIPITQKVRLWSVPRTLPAGGSTVTRSAPTPPDSPGRTEDSINPQDSWPHLLLDVGTFSEVRDGKIKVPLMDQTGNPNYNGSAALQLHNLVTDQTLVVDEAIDADWVSTYTGRSRNSERSLVARADAASSRTNSGRSSPAPQGPVTRGRAQQKRNGRSVGAVGLHNLGNTCYMNSALQCVRSVEELTKYFLTDSYVGEVNKTNPLGYNGKVAMAYAALLKEIYTEGRGAVSPRDFKTTVGRSRSTFSGWGQQDSQEFLGFLLDGLQEDLSRIKQKPYIEKPDSTDDMINDPEAIREMAEKVWDITRKRDDSVVADLFTGMYKSTLKCPECGKISITFDPFNNLTLPIPVEDMWTKSIKFLPLNEPPVKIDVELPKHSAIESLKQFISGRTGVPVDRLMGAEEFKERFFKIYDNNHDVSEEIQGSDNPTMHELEAIPTNWPSKGQRKKFRSMLDIDTPLDTPDWDDGRYERMVVPVFHRRPHAYGRSAEGGPPPHFIILTRDEASNYDLIRRKVLEKVATFSTWSKLTNNPGSEAADSADSDMVITTASDADSSGESKVAAQSVEGEDDMVDVTMRDAADGASVNRPGHSNAVKVLKRFNDRRSHFVNPQVFLDPEIQNLFDLSYFTDSSDGAVPTGWSNVDNTRTLPKLSDRMPESSVEDDQPSPESWNGTASGNEDSSDNESKEESPQTPQTPPTRMMDESSDEDVQQPARFVGRNGGNKAHHNGGAGGRKKFKGHKTYGKKGNKRRDKQMRAAKDAHHTPPVKPQPMPPAVADGGPLIRLGEGLVVDWNEEAWDAVFGGTLRTRDALQGAKTYVDVETLQDPDLKLKARRRAMRKSRGMTLDECLDEFERAEVLSEQDMWYCPRCKEHRRASKKFDLWKSPDILVAHLKRFSNSGWRRDKLDILVDFPIEGLDLTERVIQKEKGQNEIYDLIAVDDHYGGLGGGHYTGYAKNFMDGRWYNYNDSSVSPVSDPSSAVTSAAYLLFYRRRSAGPLGGPRFQKIFEKFNNPDEDEEATDSGEEQRLSGGSRLGLPSAGTGAAATRPRADYDTTRATVTALDGSDDETLPSYEGASGGDAIQSSIEDEGAEMTDGYQRVGTRSSLTMAQSWSFNGLGGNAAEPSLGVDYASDDAQADSSDEGGSSRRNHSEQDADMVSAGAGKQYLAGMGIPAPEGDERDSWERKGILSVPAASAGDRDSEEVTEIRLESERGSRGE